MLELAKKPRLDIDTDMLSVAEAGLYPEESLRSVPPRLRDPYFTRLRFTVDISSRSPPRCESS